ncbi:hypothetical protein DVH05_009549 [Phytophthora capsici]|nr:hypothetical protein DVH05_009549 [Phytophthora capsici]|eukprot:jgi/Phyca11/115436/e_gw1.28.341.1
MAPAPSPPLQIAAGSFFRYESNRTKGLKILRCFPHCCPEHIDRSYCGSPLSLSIRLEECSTETAPSEPLPSEVLCVFARFESVSDISLRVGECVEHVLKAYVMERVAVDIDDNLTTFSSPEAFTQLYRVAYIVTSPEFTVISYRRAPLEPLQAAEGSAQSQLIKAQIPRQMERRLLSAHKDLPHSRGLNDRFEIVPVFEPAEAASVMPVAHMECEDIPVHPLEDKWFWESANAPAVSTSKNLGLLSAILRWAPLRFYSPFVGELVNLVQHNLLDPISAGSVVKDKRNCFVELLLDHTQTEDELRAAGSPPIAQEIDMVLHAASQAAVWLYSKETCSWMRSFFQQYAECVLDKTQLRTCYLQFLSEVEKRLNTEVFAATPIGSLANMAEEVIAAVYSCQYFHDRRPLVRKILGGQSFAGWNMFVAQMRDTFIGATTLPRGVERQERSTFGTTYHPHNAIEENWNGEWVLDMETSSSSSSSCADTTSRDVSLYSLVAFISQVVHIEVSIDIQERALRVRSIQNLAGHLDCTHVVLDNKERVFRLFPNGITSSGLEGTYGDYVGKIRVEEPRNVVVFLEMFKWATEKGEHSYHVRLCMEYQQSGHLSVDGDILVTARPFSFTAEEMPYVGEMSLRMKRKSVEKVNTTESQTTDVSAWREHSRFHLNYCKV